ncbi:hypothetical protein K504DRAFT_223446 [Pleomassaria siparia CBS 279.74]|uniref:Uncharacterized protein n=1 Tax=Pleomassaria siparia CBS 279.74 TaxID=1314801 RepID=A0A6G1KG71_9PLEO|nr:hypothetical protein K504DRAFT_223446 [Pleomassaria siparia CBS 279.74]
MRRKGATRKRRREQEEEEEEEEEEEVTDPICIIVETRHTISEEGKRYLIRAPTAAGALQHTAHSSVQSRQPTA